MKNNGQIGKFFRRFSCPIPIGLQALHLHGVGAYGRDRIRGHLHCHLGVDDGGARQLLRPFFLQCRLSQRRGRLHR